jgi:hypothetical protein
MTSVLAAPAQLPANKLYVNINKAASTITDTLGNIVPWVTLPAASSLGVAGGAILRDLGKTVYQPNPANYNVLGSQSTIYRKVQLITTGNGGYYGTGGDATYFTGYISLGGQTYGGGNGAGGAPGGTQPWVRLN